MGLYTLDARDLEGGNDTRALLERTLRLCRETLHVRDVVVFLGPNIDSAKCVAAVGLGNSDLHSTHVNGLVTKAWNQQRPIVAARPTMSIAVRIACGRKTWGVIQCANPENGSRFSTREKRVMSLLAQELASSLGSLLALKSERLLAKQDPLTGLRNIRGLYADLDRVIARAQKAKTDAAVMFLDVDRLKHVNSRLGHAAGSEALRRVGKILREDVAEPNLVYRFGGDEFVIICPKMGLTEAAEHADSLRQAVARRSPGPMKSGGELPRITMSIGVATLRTAVRSRRRKASDSRARLLAAADRALFRAKAAGRNTTRSATKRDDRLR